MGGQTLGHLRGQAGTEMSGCVMHTHTSFCRERHEADRGAEKVPTVLERGTEALP